MQIIQDIFQVGGSLNDITWTGQYRSYEDCNTYILRKGKDLIMLDCGSGETLDQIYNNMVYWGLDPKGIKACSVTHPHLDHAGACHLLSRHGLKLFAHNENR